MSRIPLTKATSRQIVKARTELGWSQYDLAQKSGTVRSMIKRIEKHEISTVDAKVLEKIQITLSNRPKIGHAPKSTMPTMSSHKSKTLNVPRFTDGEITILKTLPKRKDLSTFEFYKVKVSGSTPFDVDQLLGCEVVVVNHLGPRIGRLNVIEDDRPILKDGDEVTIGIWFP